MSNETDSLLCLWVEPWGTDHWMRPGEVFTVATRADPENAPFNVVVHGQGISVWVNAGLVRLVSPAITGKCTIWFSVDHSYEVFGDARQIAEVLNAD